MALRFAIRCPSSESAFRARFGLLSTRSLRALPCPPARQAQPQAAERAQEARVRDGGQQEVGDRPGNTLTL